MSLYVIGDLHLSLSNNKPMDIFKGWENYMQKIETNWQSKIKPEDSVVLAGDISWAMKLTEAVEDFSFIENLNGHKYILKGNHDYWWVTQSKINKFFNEHNFTSMSILHNNSFEVEGINICGSRGWIFENGAPEDKKIIQRELGRIEASLSYMDSSLPRYMFLHYPPYYDGQEISEFFEVMKKYNVERCYYGHIHGDGLKHVYSGMYKGIELIPISADYLDFNPLKIV